MNCPLLNTLLLCFLCIASTYSHAGDYDDDYGTYWTTSFVDNELETGHSSNPLAAPRGEPATAMVASPYRLPTAIYPLAYNITLHPYFSNFTFNGDETIDIVITKQALFKPDDFLIIEINAFDIMMNHCTLYLDGMQHAIPMKTAMVDTTTQIVSMRFKIRNGEILKYMHKHNYQHSVRAMLHIQYIGIIQIDMKGFYISSFHYKGKLIHNAVTHFEATNARKFFPCFDEPSMKATFKFTVIAPKAAAVIGNTLGHEKASPHKDCYFNMHDGEHYECKQVEFEKSPKMSSYLTAMAIGDYKYVEGSMNGVNQRIYFPIQNSKRATFALDMSLKVLTFYEKLLHLKYPLRKMYSLAVNDFKAGAMENLGMVTYRDIRLMCDEHKSTLDIKQHVALVIAHEFSHQWFGNMVTMDWWSDIWLNEGFAAFMEFVGGDHVHPEYHLWDTFYFETHRAMQRDASAETHQIVLKVEDPTDVRALFDGITYHKGAGVLHMLHEYLGNEVFFGKIRNYLQKYKFSNANTQQLFHELGGTKIVDMMNSWVHQPGTPVIMVQCSIAGDHKLKFTLTQQRIRPNMRDGSPVHTGRDQIWQIPLKMKDAKGTMNDLDLFKDESVEFELDRVRDGEQLEYYMLNPSMQSFVFTNYDTLSLNMLVRSFKKLDKVDQFLLVADRFALMSFNVISGDQYMEFLNEVVKAIDIEHNAIVNSLLWRMIVDSLMFIDDIFCELYQSRNRELRSLRMEFRQYSRDILRPVWHKIGGFGHGNNAHEKNTDIIMLRPVLLAALVRFDDIQIIEQGFEILAQCLEKHGGELRLDADGYIDCFDLIDQNILEQLMEAGLAKHNHDGDDELVFDELISIYKDANNEIQSMILGSIGAVYKNPHLLQMGVKFVLSHSVRVNVKGHGMASLRRCYGRELVWNDLLRRSRGQPRQVGMASTFAKQSVYNLVYSFYFGAHHGLILRLPESKERIIKSVLEKVAMNIKFLNGNKFKMMQWMKSYMSQKPDARRGFHADVLVEEEEDLMDEQEEEEIIGAGDVLAHHSHRLHHHPRQKEHLSRTEKRFSKQLNGATATTATMSPRQSLLLMITLFFVIISSCLIALWLYSVHKNTLII